MALVKRLLEQWDRSLAVVLLVAGMVALILGYEGVSRTEFVAAQIPYFISGGLVGLFLLGAAGVLWLSSDLRDDWVKLQEIDARLDQIQNAVELRSSPPAPPRSARSTALTDGDQPAARRRARTTP